MFTDQYYETLKRSQLFQQKSANWAGDGSYQYTQQLREIVKQHDCQTMLDYGCGKGLQYPQGAYNFAQLIRIKDYAMHDPAYEKYAELLPGTWDLVICLDVLPFIPESDIDTVIELMVSRCNKICVIGLQDIFQHQLKSKKPFVCVHDRSWWEEKLKHKKVQLIWQESTKPFNVEEFIAAQSIWTRFKNFIKSTFL